MRRSFLLLLLACLVISCFSFAQAGEGSAGSGSAATTSTGVAPDDIVLSFEGFCDSDLLIIGKATGVQPKPDAQAPAGEKSASSAPASNCKTEVTRSQFESLADALGYRTDRPNKIRAAVRYPELLNYAEKAKALGLDKDPTFETRVRYAYLNLLWQSYNSYLVKQADNISDQQVQQLYKNQPDLFVQADLQRLFVPNEKKHADFPASQARINDLLASDAASMKTVADSLQKRARAGEDLAKLQLEAVKAAGEDASEAPDIDVGETTRADVSEEYAEVFQLKPGEISALIEAPKGWYVCKVVSKSTLPLDEARGLLQRMRQRQATEAAKSSVKPWFNDAYFNVPHGMETGKSSGGGAR